MSEYIETCPACLQPCSIKACDDGIGAYEYWGARGYDSRPYAGSNCCEAALLEPYIKSKDIDDCHFNGHTENVVTCSKCPFNDYCTDALPVEDEA